MMDEHITRRSQPGVVYFEINCWCGSHLQGYDAMPGVVHVCACMRKYRLLEDSDQ